MALKMQRLPSVLTKVNTDGSIALVFNKFKIYFPVLPKPPAPRSVSSRESVSINLALK